MSILAFRSGVLGKQHPGKKIPEDADWQESPDKKRKEEEHHENYPEEVGIGIIVFTKPPEDSRKHSLCSGAVQLFHGQ